MGRTGFALFFVAIISLVTAAAAQDVDGLIRKGETLAKARQFKAALVPLNAAIVQAPKNAVARRWRGRCHNALGRHARALDDFNVVLGQDSNDADCLYSRGRAKHHLRMHKDAIVDYTRSLDLAPKNPTVLRWRGKARSQARDFLGAYTDFSSVIEHSTADASIFMARGRAALRLMATRRAEADFTRAIGAGGLAVAAKAYAEIGFLRTAAGERKAALKSFEKAYDLTPVGQDYARLWRYWLKADAGVLGDDSRDQLPAKGWAGSLARTLLGELTHAQLLQRLPAGDLTAADMIRRRGQANFYLGIRSLLTKKPHRAREYFKEALAYGDPTLPEWRVAQVFARR